jgi:hypothetical protein
VRGRDDEQRERCHEGETAERHPLRI